MAAEGEREVIRTCVPLDVDAGERLDPGGVREDSYLPPRTENALPEGGFFVPRRHVRARPWGAVPHPARDEGILDPNAKRGFALGSRMRDTQLRRGKFCGGCHHFSFVPVLYTERLRLTPPPRVEQPCANRKRRCNQ